MKKKITLPDTAIRLGMLAPHILRNKKTGMIHEAYPTDLLETTLAFEVGLGTNMPMTIKEAADKTGVSYAAAHRAAKSLTPVLGKAPHYIPGELFEAIGNRKKPGRPSSDLKWEKDGKTFKAKKAKHPKGQTLVELIVSLTIIASLVTLTALAIP
jgi:prepilin-type N-terminal cleavage/methylation domain-containing protein